MQVCQRRTCKCNCQGAIGFCKNDFVLRNHHAFVVIDLDMHRVK